MKLLDLPTEILQTICRPLVTKNSGRGRSLDITSTVCLSYTLDHDKQQVRDRPDHPHYNAEMQVLRVCRRLYDIGWPLVYGEHRFSCLQPVSFKQDFAEQIGELNLKMIARLRLRIPKESSLPADEHSTKLVRFLVERMPGLKALELSKRWRADLDGSNESANRPRNTEERVTILWITQQILRGLQQLQHTSWAWAETQPYSNGNEDAVWTKVTITLTSISPIIVGPRYIPSSVSDSRAAAAAKEVIPRGQIDQFFIDMMRLDAASVRYLMNSCP